MYDGHPQGLFKRCQNFAFRAKLMPRKDKLIWSMTQKLTLLTWNGARPFMGDQEMAFSFTWCVLFLFIFCFFTNRPRSPHIALCKRGKWSLTLAVVAPTAEQWFEPNCMYALVLKHGLGNLSADKTDSLSVCCILLHPCFVFLPLTHFHLRSRAVNGL